MLILSYGIMYRNQTRWSVLESNELGGKWSAVLLGKLNSLSWEYRYVTLRLPRIVIYHRAIHDVKATDLGLGKVRFKAEVDFDGRVVTRSYLEKQDFDRMMQVSFCSHRLLL